MTKPFPGILSKNWWYFWRKHEGLGELLTLSKKNAGKKNIAKKESFLRTAEKLFDGRQVIIAAFSDETFLEPLFSERIE